MVFLHKVKTPMVGGTSKLMHYMYAKHEEQSSSAQSDEPLSDRNDRVLQLKIMIEHDKVRDLHILMNAKKSRPLAPLTN